MTRYNGWESKKKTLAFPKFRTTEMLLQTNFNPKLLLTVTWWSAYIELLFMLHREAKKELNNNLRILFLSFRRIPKFGGTVLNVKMCLNNVY